MCLFVSKISYIVGNPVYLKWLKSNLRTPNSEANNSYPRISFSICIRIFIRCSNQRSSAVPLARILSYTQEHLVVINGSIVRWGGLSMVFKGGTYMIHNGTLETFIWSIMWKITSFFRLENYFIFQNLNHGYPWLVGPWKLRLQTLYSYPRRWKILDEWKRIYLTWFRSTD